MVRRRVSRIQETEVPCSRDTPAGTLYGDFDRQPEQMWEVTMRIAHGSWRRAAAALGLLFAVLGVMVGYGLYHTTSDASGNQALPSDASGAFLAKYITVHESEFNTSLVAGGLLVLFLVFFAVALSEHFSSSERPLRPFGELMLGAAFLASALLLVVEMVEFAMIDVTPRDDTQSLRVLWQLAYAGEVPVAFALGLLITVTGVAAWRTRALPRWIAVFSLIGGAVQITLGPIFGGGGPAGVSLWAIVISGALFVERKRATKGAPIIDEVMTPAATRAGMALDKDVLS
jgi:hypothetical protein